MSGSAPGRRTTRCLVPATAVLLTGCAGAATGPVGDSAPGPAYAVTTTVLESPDHGPQLCLGGVAESLPPQCSGPDVVGWDWAAVEDEESVGGTTWGVWSLTGTWDGERFTLTAPPALPQPSEPPDEPEDPFAAPCEPPPGGWAVVDPAIASEQDRQAAIEHARAQPGHAGAWLDQLDDPGEPVREEPYDPAGAVLVLAFTGNLAEHEAQARERWGGPLCVTAAEHTLAELLAVQEEVHRELEGVLGSGVDEVRGVVQVSVPVVDDALGDELARRWPAGVVEAVGVLQPVG